MPNKKESEKGFTGVFVIDHLIKEGIIKEEESKKLAHMMSSHDEQMREVAKYILLDRWKVVYPTTTVTMKSRLLKRSTDE